MAKSKVRIRTNTKTLVVQRDKEGGKSPLPNKMIPRDRKEKLKKGSVEKRKKKKKKIK